MISIYQTFENLRIVAHLMVQYNFSLYKAEIKKKPANRILHTNLVAFRCLFNDHYNCKSHG